jgi:hypothetical protein
MANHQYQLVLEFAESNGESDDCRELLDLLEATFEDQPEVLVDEYDSGGGYFNLFIHTNTPLETFAIAKKMLDREGPSVDFRSGYRDFNLDDYVPVHPPRLKQFSLR